MRMDKNRLGGLLAWCVLVTWPLVGAAEDCVPPHPTLEQLGLFDTDTLVCPVRLTAGPDVTVTTTGQELHVWEGDVVDPRACPASHVKVAFKPDAWDGPPPWGPGTALWLLDHDPNRRSVSDEGTLYVGLEGGCSANIDAVPLADGDAWKAARDGKLPDDLVVLERHDKDPKAYGLPADTAYWRFAHVAYSTWIGDPKQGDLKAVTWGEVLKGRAKTATK